MAGRAATASGSSAGITVVIPTHNRLAYLRDAVRSALEQPGGVEVVVVDDASTDETPAWLAAFRDPHLRFYRQEQGKGGSAARNLGLVESRSPYVLFLDDDDILRPGALGLLRDALEAHPAAAGAAGAYVRFGAVDALRRDLHPRRTVVAPLWRELLFGWNMPPAALLWRASAVRELGGWDTTLARGEDRDLNLRAYRQPFVLVPDVVMDYRVHPAQVPTGVSMPIHQHVVSRFVASLAGGDRRIGEAILCARDPFLDGLSAYSDGDYRRAVVPLTRVLRGGTTLWRSPVLGSWLTGLAVKAAMGAALPVEHARALHRRVRRRAPYHQPSPSPEHDAVP